MELSGANEANFLDNYLEHVANYYVHRKMLSNKPIQRQQSIKHG